MSACFAWFYLFMVRKQDGYEAVLGHQLLARADFGVGAGLALFLGIPIFEEFIFRGLIYRGLRRKLRPIGAVLASSLLFALVHPPILFIPFFVLGGVSALVFEATGTLAASVIAHAIYNLLVLIARG